MDDATPFSAKPTLVGPRVILRPFTPADIDAMGPIRADPEVGRLTTNRSGQPPTG